MSIQVLRGPSISTDNPVLAEGQPYVDIESNPPKLKIGDGVTNLNSLPYIGAEMASDIYQDTGIYPPNNPLAFSLGSSSRYADFTYTKTLNVGDSTGTLGIDINLASGGGQYKDEKYGIKLGDSDICQLNGLWLYRGCNSNTGNGLYFYYRTGDDNTTTYWDRLYVNSGHLYIQPNITKTQDTSSVARTTILDSTNFNTYALSLGGGNVSGPVTARSITSTMAALSSPYGLNVGETSVIDSDRNGKFTTVTAGQLTINSVKGIQFLPSSNAGIISARGNSTTTMMAVLSHNPNDVCLNALTGELILGEANTDDIVLKKPTYAQAAFVIKSYFEIDTVTYPNLRTNNTATALHINNGSSASSGVVLSGTNQFRPSGNGNVTLGVGNHRWGQIYSSASTISTSDRNMKHDIADIPTDFAKNIVMGLKPVSYKFDDGTSNRTHHGFIAQDIAELLQSLDIDSQDYAAYIKWQKTELVENKETHQLEDIDVPGEYEYGLRYEELIAPLVKVVQFQQQEIDTLKTQLNLITEE